ncbi:hypothetical protein ACFU3E_04610 [Streptomyces sp. NPDC057424]|uniref:hypothetical protein n=1 Tax=Streptomyces sp. NPDC057424 TaxID=3346127 RepID=UPI0036A9E765
MGRSAVGSLAGELIRHPGRAGLDDHEPVLAAVPKGWLAGHGLPYRRLHDDADRPVAPDGDRRRPARSLGALTPG